MKSLVNRNSWKFLAVGVALQTILVACPPPPVPPSTVKLEGLFRADRSVKKCSALPITAEISNYNNVDPGKVTFQYDFADGSALENTRFDKVQKIFVKEGEFRIKARALIEGQTEPGLENTLIVTVQSGAECAYIVELKNNSGTRLSAQKVKALASSIIGDTGGEELATFTNVLQGFAARYDPTKLPALQARTEVDALTLSSVVETTAVQNNPGNWGIDRIDQRDRPMDDKFNFTAIGRNTDIYILDTGVRASHPEFTGRVKSGYNVFTKNADTLDSNGHGTHVAGLAAGATVGVARGANIIPVKVFPDASGLSEEWAFVKGMDWVIANLNPKRRAVVNLSAGMGIGQKAERAIDKAARNFAIQNPNLVMVLAAGNQAKDACEYSPARVASGSSVITVGATDRSDNRATISNRGECINIYAPGVAIRSASHNNDLDYTEKTGTSQAAPLVAGAAAAYLESNPLATAQQVKDALIASSTKGKLSGTVPDRLLYLEQPIAVNVQPSSATISVGEEIEFNAVVEGTSQKDVTWEFSAVGGQSNGSKFTFKATQPGTYELIASSAADSTKRTAVRIVVQGGVLFNAANSSMQVGTSQNLTVQVVGLSNNLLTWDVTPDTGNTLVTSGLTAVFTPSNAGTYTIRATSQADPSKTASVQIVATAGVTVSLNPSTASLITNQSQNFNASVLNSSNTNVTWSVTPTANASITSNGLSASFSASVAGAYTVTATSVADPSKSASSSVTVSNPSATTNVTVNPPSNTIFTGATQNLSATVTGNANTAVTWSVTPTTNTTLTPNGNDVSFSSTSAGVYTITATSVADTSKSASSSITVQVPPPISVSLNQSTATISLGGTQQLSATVNNSSNQNVTWTSSNNSVATVSSTGLVTTATVGTTTITATSVADPSKNASASITTRDAVQVTPLTANLQINASQNFNANVIGLSSSNVSWSVSPTTGVSLTSGSTSATFSSSQAGTYTLTATSSVDSSKKGSASITVLPNVTVSLTPSTSQTIDAGTILNVSANVTGSANTGVTWSVSPSENVTLTFNGNAVGFRTNFAGNYTLTATSTINTFRSASVSITVQPAVGLTPNSSDLIIGQELVLTGSAIGFTNNDLLWNVQPLTGASLIQNGNNATFSADRVGTWTVRITSAEDSSKTVTSTIRVSSGVQITTLISSVNRNTNTTFIASVNPSLGGSVNWSVSPNTNVTLTLNGNSVVLRATVSGAYVLSATSSTNAIHTSSFKVFVTQLNRIDGGSGFTTALKNDVTLWAFGQNNTGKIGDGTATTRLLPVQVQSDVRFTSSGGGHAMLVKNNGTLWTVGDNSRGQLGDRTLVSKSTYAQVMTDVVAISAGQAHSLALKSDGTLWSWGMGGQGQLGNGTTVDSATPTQIMTNVVAISAGHEHSLVLKSDATVWTFGNNRSGRLCDGTTTNRNTPVQIATDTVAIEGGGDFSLLLKSNNTLWGCGDNFHGQLADGTTVNRYTLILITGSVLTMAAGNNSSYVLLLDNRLFTSGENASGQLGDGTTNRRYTLLHVMSNVVAVSAGIHHAIVLQSNGALFSFGLNDAGQLGDGTITNRSTPIQVMTGVMLP